MLARLADAPTRPMAPIMKSRRLRPSLLSFGMANSPPRCVRELRIWSQGVTFATARQVAEPSLRCDVPHNSYRVTLLNNTVNVVSLGIGGAAASVTDICQEDGGSI